jgi:hypothetical protein
MSMSENVVDRATSDPFHTVSGALDTAVQAARDGAADARAAVDRVLPAASRFVSRFVYTTCYTFSYGVVFPTILIAKSIPADNPIVSGFVDGARAAVDRVAELKGGHLAGPVRG